MLAIYFIEEKPNLNRQQHFFKTVQRTSILSNKKGLEATSLNSNKVLSNQLRINAEYSFRSS